MSTQPDLVSICYKRNFLTEVIARIDFVSPLDAVAKELPKAFSKVALMHFPIDEPKPAFAQELLVSEKEIATRRQEFMEWNFHGRNRDKRLTLTPQAFFVTYKKYEAYENLRTEFVAVVEVFFSCFEQAQPSRLGLRYINQLDVPGENPLDWGRYVNDRLLGLFSYSVQDAEPARIFHNFEAVFRNFNLRFQFGLHNPDYPAPIRRRLFILDYDAYFNGLLEPREISSSLDVYHDAIQALFEQSITDQLREVMRGAD
jgi:uncharacterized protein (TIGR04255 family)